FEYVITFELERRRIWRSRLSAVTVIFLINRYLAVAYSISMILSLCVVTEAVIVVANRLCVIAADIIVLWSTWLKTFRHRQELAGLGFTTNIPYLLLRDG
ncbi:hypothetical protein BC629DRAFT_1275220, partial [Irpex lacteus]